MSHQYAFPVQNDVVHDPKVERIFNDFSVISSVSMKLCHTFAHPYKSGLLTLSKNL